MERRGVRKPSAGLHADNGGSMKGSTMLATLQRLGATSRLLVKLGWRRSCDYAAFLEPSVDPVSSKAS
jgi:hypothetical protein